MRQEIPFEAALKVWVIICSVILSEATIPQVSRLLEIIRDELARRDLVLRSLFPPPGCLWVGCRA